MTRYEPRDIPCPKCGGSNAPRHLFNLPDVDKCDVCKGHGEITLSEFNAYHIDRYVEWQQKRGGKR